MRICTQDLLKIRDGEPVDADLHVRVTGHAESQAELQRLREVQRALQDLPVLQPPGRTWAKISAEVERERNGVARTKALWRWPLRSAVAAGVAVAALMLLARDPETVSESTLGPTTTVAVDATDSGLDRRLAEPSYASLAAESARLEQALGRIGYRPRLVNADTASTIAIIEDRIGFVDAQLTYATAQRLSDRQTEALWRQRVDLMSALVNLRYAQAQGAGF